MKMDMEDDHRRHSCSASRLGAPLSMILVQVFTTGMLLLSKVALGRGTFVFAFLAYRNAIGALFLAPFALLLEREMLRKLNWKAAMWIFISAFFGILMALSLYYYGLRDTTAAFSSNFLNLIPIITFVFAVVAGMEMLELSSRVGKIKVIGSLLCVGGAMTVSLYRGRALHIWPSDRSVIHLNFAKEEGMHHWLRGTLFLLCSCFSYAAWFIVQVKLLQVYPSKYCTTMLTCMAGSFQTALVGIIVDRQKHAWSLRWDLQLLTIVYTGIFNTDATFCLISWVIAQRGPTYPSMFNSLSVIFTTVLESLLMGQDITTGSLLGMLVIIGGLYAFLWGKGKELPPQKVRVGDIQSQDASHESLSPKR
ncbi:WAT1-related protein-like isoform X1 [Iris pallida]|uniref:WAT1-related protein n=1 Tax=Iris pallida TaxID=29817 RepID=A0AAX6IEE5_IRIPA|nr:WAT1-related protein-like isoform X1 [Iris pallida]